MTLSERIKACKTLSEIKTIEPDIKRGGLDYYAHREEWRAKKKEIKEGVLHRGLKP